MKVTWKRNYQLVVILCNNSSKPEAEKSCTKLICHDRLDKPLSCFYHIGQYDIIYTTSTLQCSNDRAKCFWLMKMLDILKNFMENKDITIE